MTTPLLRITGLHTHYGPSHILKDVDMEILEGEIVCLLGSNGAGKTTALKTILGLIQPTRGTIEFAGESMQDRPTPYRIEKGMAVVPENRRIFGPMSVRENLLMGAYRRRDAAGVKEDMERVLALFPRLKERLNQPGGTMSGGEQQMLAMARGLMARPRLLLMDEPSMGLAPVLVEQNFEIIQQVNRLGTTIFVVEQNASMALSVAHRGYVLQTGRVVLADKAENLLNDALMRKAYLGH
jgi:branched-chain amino acid transport system ATP-binding protein